MGQGLFFNFLDRNLGKNLHLQVELFCDDDNLKGPPKLKIDRVTLKHATLQYTVQYDSDDMTVSKRKRKTSAVELSPTTTRSMIKMLMMSCKSTKL